MEIEETLTTIDSLVARTEQGEFLGRELFPYVFELIKDPSSLPEDKLSVAEGLFHRIAATHKSTYHGCNFYDKLRESSLPFVHQVFERAVYTEPYYNCKPNVLGGYLVSTLRRNGYEDKGMFRFLQSFDLLYKHSGEPLDLASLPEEDSEKIQKAIVYFLNDHGCHSTGSGLVAATIFPFPEVQSVIETNLIQEIRETEKLINSPPEVDRRGPQTYRSDMVSVMARALYYIKGEDRYKELDELFKEPSEIEGLRQKWSSLQERVRLLMGSEII